MSPEKQVHALICNTIPAASPSVNRAAACQSAARQLKAELPAPALQSFNRLQLQSTSEALWLFGVVLPTPLSAFTWLLLTTTAVCRSFGHHTYSQELQNCLEALDEPHRRKRETLSASDHRSQQHHHQKLNVGGCLQTTFTFFSFKVSIT